MEDARAQGIQKYLGRVLAGVEAGKGDSRKTGVLLGGHDKTDIFVRCTSACCFHKPWATGSGESGGCILTATGFERHAKCGAHKKWRDSLRVLPAPNGAAGSSGGGSSARGPVAALASHGADVADDVAAEVARALWPTDCGLTVGSFLEKACRALEAVWQLTGKPIWVFWPCEDRWFRGEVVQFITDQGKTGRKIACYHEIRYADGDTERLHLAQELFRLEAPPGWRDERLLPQRQARQGERRREGSASQAGEDAAEGQSSREESLVELQDGEESNSGVDGAQQAQQPRSWVPRAAVEHQLGGSGRGQKRKQGSSSGSGCRDAEGQLRAPGPKQPGQQSREQGQWALPPAFAPSGVPASQLRQDAGAEQPPQQQQQVQRVQAAGQARQLQARPGQDRQQQQQALPDNDPLFDQLLSVVTGQATAAAAAAAGLTSELFSKWLVVMEGKSPGRLEQPQSNRVQQLLATGQYSGVASMMAMDLEILGFGLP